MTAFMNIVFRDNSAYLAAELERLDAHLRLRLAVLRRPLQVRPDASGQGLAISAEQVDSLLGDSLLGDSLLDDSLLDDSLLEDSPEAGGSEEEVVLRQRAQDLDEALDARVEASPRAGVELGLPRLRRIFQLSALETRVILICLAPELRRKYDTIYAYLQDDITRQRPSIDLILNLLFASEADRWLARDMFSPTAPLMRFGLLRAVDDPGSPSGSSALARFLELDPRTLHFLLDQPTLDVRLRELMGLWKPTEDVGDEAIDPRVDRLIALANRDSERRLVVHLHGPHGAGRRDLARAVCAGLGRPLLSLDLSRLPEEAFEALLRLALRESMLFEAPLYLEGIDVLLKGEGSGEARLLALAQGIRCTPLGGMLFLAGENPWTRLGLFEGAVFHSLALTTPPVPVRELIWRRALEPLGALKAGVSEEAGDIGDLTIGYLARRFRLTPGQIRDAALGAERVRILEGNGRPLEAADLVAASRDRSTLKLGELATRIEPRHGWDDLVLPEEKRRQLIELTGQVKNRYRVYGEWGFGGKLSRGKAVSALFTGPPGTGKTLAAEVLAGDLGLDLYKIDLSRVVSKYIGETEKNLGRIFDEAEQGNVVLFFDEADALFGKRTEVSDAHDRYANIETSYLLQKMEEHDGVVILASNLGGNMDEAFLRRLRYLVEFPFPDVAGRQRIWRAHFPAAAPVGDIDCGLLGEKLRLAGGHIRNIVVSAAFFAAADGGVIQMEHVCDGARREFEKIGRSWDEKSLLGDPRVGGH